MGYDYPASEIRKFVVRYKFYGSYVECRGYTSLDQLKKHGDRCITRATTAFGLSSLTYFQLDNSKIYPKRLAIMNGYLFHDPQQNALNRLVCSWALNLRIM